MEEKPELSPSLSWTALGLLLAAGVIALAVWLVSMLWGPFAYRAGLAGTPGTLTAAHCHVTGSGKYSKRDCSGTFVASTGAFTDGSAHTYDVARIGDSPLRVQRRSDGGYTQPRADRAATALSVIFGIVSGAAALLLFLCLLPLKVSFGKGVRLGANPQPWGALLWLLSRVSVGAAIASAASLAMMIVLAIFQRFL
ncbi:MULTISPECIES: hypothetical protein [Streptomyces]|uniref:hypothetical protein n=1 Tax=Streptomyces TaxID=1883 RepID=UPI001963676C|nr:MULTISPECIES: hypothetical protein [Streptomyces]QRX95170.1 hypothetical protein JNO44_34030 [Streptomyces noursei]UJB46006.1 hypothetical protein HRD51_39365 [Streptomyces sp. A1-5]